MLDLISLAVLVIITPSDFPLFSCRSTGSDIAAPIGLAGCQDSNTQVKLSWCQVPAASCYNIHNLTTGISFKRRTATGGAVSTEDSFASDHTAIESEQNETDMSTG